MADESSRPADESTISDAALKEKTGRTWREWFSFLDGHGAALLDQRAILQIISRTGTGLSAWWRQVIATAYEQARTIRETGERVGQLGAKATRSINAPVRALRGVVSDAAKRTTWLSERLHQLQKALDKRPASAIRGGAPSE